MKAYAVVFDYSVDYCYECGKRHERHLDTVFLTEAKAKQRYDKLVSKKGNKGKVRIEEIVIGE